jgi:nicotinamide-nucleotide amidase
LIDENLLKKVTNFLKEKKLTISIAESCTGGLIAHTLTNISGSSEYFDRGIISYSNRAKTELLGVSDDVLKKYGAVSKQVAKVMAESIRIKSNVDLGIATTGIAGPTGGTKEKPVGLVFIAISNSEGTYIRRYKFSGNRLQNKELTCNAALWMILDHLKKCR